MNASPSGGNCPGTEILASWDLCSATPRNRAFRARSWAKQFNRRGAKDAEKRLRLEISASIAPLRFSWPWVLVAAPSPCAFALGRLRFTVQLTGTRRTRSPLSLRDDLLELAPSRREKGLKGPVRGIYIASWKPNLPQPPARRGPQAVHRLEPSPLGRSL